MINSNLFPFEINEVDFRNSIVHLFFLSQTFKDAPVCSTFHDELLGALKHETLSLICEVDASPSADSFHWTFNSSGEQTELPSRLYTSEVKL